MFEWLNNQFSKVKINTNSNEKGPEIFGAMFGIEAAKLGMTLHSAFIALSNCEMKEVSAALKFDGIDLKLINTNRDKKGEIFFSALGWPDGVIEVTENNQGTGENKVTSVTVQVDTVNERALLEIISKLKGFHRPSKSNKGRVYVLTNAGGGLGYQSVGIAGKDLEKTNYSDATVSDFDYIIENLKSNEPNGRIVLLDGPPGTGKTYYTRSIIGSVPKATFIIIPPNMVDSLSGPGLMTFFLTYRNNFLGSLVLVIEDADKCLVPRASDNISMISTLLNMTDGIIGNLLDIRIIATTNANLGEIDEAILRPGRLMKHTHIGPLSAKDANRAYKKITGENGDFTSNTTLAEVYFKSKGTNEAITDISVVPRRVGFGS